MDAKIHTKYTNKSKGNISIISTGSRFVLLIGVMKRIIIKGVNHSIGPADADYAAGAADRLRG